MSAPSRTGLLAWTAGLGAVGADGLQLRLGVTAASARGLLAAAVRAGEMRVWRVADGVPPLYTLTPRGLRQSGRTGLAPGRVSPAGARHAAACCLAAAALERAFPGCEVLGEQSVRRLERDAGRPLASLRPERGASAGERRAHRPDLLLLADERQPPVAIEVELTVKAPARLEAICRAWARSRAVDGVIYLATVETLSPLRRAVAAAAASERVAVVALDALAGAAAARPPR